MTEIIAWCLCSFLAGVVTASIVAIRWIGRRPPASPQREQTNDQFTDYIAKRFDTATPEKIGGITVGPPQIEHVNRPSKMSAEDSSAVKFVAHVGGKWKEVCFVESVGHLIKVRQLGAPLGAHDAIEIAAVHPKDRALVKSLWSGDPGSQDEVAFRSEIEGNG